MKRSTAALIAMTLTIAVAPTLWLSSQAAAQSPSQTVRLSHPSRIDALGELEIHWDGPAGSSDYIDIAPADRKTPDGESAWSRLVRSKGPVVDLRLLDDTREIINPVVLQAPATPGDYVVRYIAAEGNFKNRRILATRRLTVAAQPVSLAAQSRVEPGQDLTIRWRGPASKGDYIDIVVAGQAGFSRWWAYSYVANGAPVTLEAPSRPGDYEIRYVIDGPEGPYAAARRPLSVQ
ncbi:MAG: hypothetical protein AAFQ67_08920 [Pseudomonadota bacterium]